MLADDLFPVPGWDALLWRDIVTTPGANEPLAIQASDGEPDDWLLRHPIVNRPLYDLRGFIFHPDFYGVFCDNDLTAWCYINVRVKRAEHFEVQHVHPFNGNRPPDAISNLQNSREAYQYGSQAFGKLWPQMTRRHIIETHSVWIGPKLGLMERLTLTLLLRYGHKPTLWHEADFDQSSVPLGVVCKLLPSHAMKPIRFNGRPNPAIPNGGIGSFAHWSDYFGALTLREHGGLWVQLDVAALAPIELAETAFSQWLGGISPCVWSAPKGSKFAKEWGSFVAENIVDGWTGGDWHDSMSAMPNFLNRSRTLYGLLSDREYYDCGGRDKSPFNLPLNDPRVKLIHWSNATHGQNKESPIEGSCYAELCKRERLI